MDETKEPQEKPPVFPRLNRIVIALLLAAFAALLSGYRFGSFGTPETREFLAAHLAITALLLAAPGAQFLDRFAGGTRVALVILLMLFAMASAMLGISNLILAGKALVKFDAARLWIVALTAPGVLGVWKYFWHIASQQEANQGNGNAAITPSPERNEAAIAAEAAAAQTIPAPRATLQAYLRAAIFYAVYLEGFLALIIIAFAYYYFVDAALFSDWFAGWGALIRAFRAGIVAGAPTLIPVPIILLLFVGGQGVFKAIGQAIDLAVHPDADRALNPAEIMLIRDTSRKLEDFLKAQPKNPRVVTVYFLSIVLFFVLLGLGILFSFSNYGMGAFLFRPERTGGLEWFIYRDEIGVAEILAVFTFIFVYWALVMAIGLFWPAFAIHSDLESKSQTAPNYDVRVVLRQAIARSVRLHMVTDVDAFDPQSFLMRGWRSMTGWVAGITALLAAVNAGFWYLDRMDYALITEDYIVYTDYWTSKSHKVGYDSVARIETSCHRDSDDQLQIGYDFVLDNDRRIEVASYSNPKEFHRLGSDFANLSKADAKARAAGAVIDSSRVSGDCRADLEDPIGRELAEKTMAILTE